MKVEGKHFRTIWLEGEKVKTIDQRFLPHKFVVEDLKSVEDVSKSIKDMHIREDERIQHDNIKLEETPIHSIKSKEINGIVPLIFDDSVEVYRGNVEFSLKDSDRILFDLPPFTRANFLEIIGRQSGEYCPLDESKWVPINKLVNK